NIFLTSEGGVKILDFGVARMVEAAPLQFESVTTAMLQTTEPGMVIGTVPYMSPEQIGGKQVDARSDIFSFGSLLYAMVSGRTPFSRSTVPETIAAILTEEPPKLDPSAHEFPPALEQIILRCLQKNRKDRYQSIHELMEALKSLAAPPVTAKSTEQVWWARWRAATLIFAGLTLTTGFTMTAIQSKYHRQVFSWLKRAVSR